MKSMIRTLFIVILCICSAVACVDSNRTKIERLMRTQLKRAIKPFSRSLSATSRARAALPV